MSDLIAPIRGMKDIYCDEYKIFKYIENTSYELARVYGFQGIQTPIAESIQVFDRTLGENSDVISKELYHFHDKKGRMIALRPEFTAGIMRAILSNKLQQNLPLRLFSFGPLFRYDRPQEGRQRQFHQLNFESIGQKHAIIDAEMISCAQNLLNRLEISNDVTLELNSLGCAESKEAYQNALFEYFSKYSSELSADSQKRLEKNPLRILDSKDEKDKLICNTAPQIIDYYTSHARKYFDEVCKNLNILNIDYKINTRLVRGLDYYSDIIFEYTTTKLGAQNTILAGGRYDGLAKIMGGPDIPAIGFAAGYERIILMRQFKPSVTRPVYIIPLNLNHFQDSLILSQTLRQNNIITKIEIENKTAKRMQTAIADNARYIIFIGEDEISNNFYTLKDLDNKNERKLSLQELVIILSSMLI
ncbi:MAG: histidine--tRNA ligase [Rickettsiaceae bacterium]|nr:histidine--tRNA ligase [Rickettsiaceae bacterium]